MKKLSAFLCVLALLTAVIPLKTHALSASAYAVLEKESGRVLYARNEKMRLPMASTTKVMTALLVIEQLNLDTEYAVPDEAVGIRGSSIYLEKGERLTGRELLYGLMLASGNDAAYALAILTDG
ncbi:MAG: D-alanyl-D-alanine carboxypeptidase, partial [Clostridia bacterium]|nr:D-alanyl-D-alanine carboxypeptidase [Clostridia bacterium]